MLVSRAFHLLFSKFHWKGICADVEKFVLECQTYQQMKDSTLKPADLLSPIAHSKCYFWRYFNGFHNWTSSIATPCCYIADNRLSLQIWPLYCPADQIYYSQKVVMVFAGICLFYMDFLPPLFVIMIPLFLSEFWQELHRLQGTWLAWSSPYYPFRMPNRGY